MMWAPPKTINYKYGRIIALIDMDCEFRLQIKLSEFVIRKFIKLTAFCQITRFLLSSRRAIESEFKRQANHCATIAI